jgi:polyisoprenoid-binding protein YceI
MMRNVVTATALALMTFVNTSFAAEWKLDGENSQLNFISTKKSDVSEIHTFKNISGNVDASGNVVVDIDLASVDTKVAVRDERMTTYLFETASYPTAILSANIKTEVVDALAVGANARMQIDANLALHGQTVPLTLDIIVTRLVDSKLSVVSAQPVLLKASDFNLVAGIDKLRELANLPSISQSVPVSFYLTFGLE